MDVKEHWPINGWTIIFFDKKTGSGIIVNEQLG